jgi:hypothetical protein
MLGFDTLSQNHCADDHLAGLASRTADSLTRCGLLKRGSVTHGYYLRATQPRQQLRKWSGVLIWAFGKALLAMSAMQHAVGSGSKRPVRTNFLPSCPTTR